MKKLILIICVCIAFLACNNKEHSHDAEHEHSKEQYDQEHKSALAKTSVGDKKSSAMIMKELTEKGFQIFHYVDEETQDTIIMQQYYMAFLRTGPIRNQNEEEAEELQKQHLAHLGKMYELGYADISGPFGDDGDIRGVTIYNVPTQKMADSLANSDPSVKAGRLTIEIHPWWAAKGFGLR